MTRTFTLAAEPYDLTPLSTKAVLAHRGLRVQLTAYAHQLANIREGKIPTEALMWDIEDIHAGTPEELVRTYMREQIEEADIARSRVHFGIQFAQRLGSLLENVEGIRVIGAESRLVYRPPERGIRDLDLMIDWMTKRSPTLPELTAMRVLQYRAEHQTGIPIDIVAHGLKITPANMEHLFAIFDEPILHRGFPVFWRTEQYLQKQTRAKLEYTNRSIAALR